MARCSSRRTSQCASSKICPAKPISAKDAPDSASSQVCDSPSTCPLLRARAMPPLGACSSSLPCHCSSKLRCAPTRSACGAVRRRLPAANWLRPACHCKAIGVACTNCQPVASGLGCSAMLNSARWVFRPICRLGSVCTLAWACTCTRPWCAPCAQSLCSESCSADKAPSACNCSWLMRKSAAFSGAAKAGLAAFLSVFTVFFVLASRRSSGLLMAALSCTLRQPPCQLACACALPARGGISMPGQRPNQVLKSRAFLIASCICPCPLLGLICPLACPVKPGALMCRSSWACCAALA